ncbi:MAG: hypothetical protein QGH11_10035, partial [Pirellulaceae bacterium]|nr:hypothetical protein [Pirellulaceae bacterium]
MNRRRAALWLLSVVFAISPAPAEEVAAGAEGGVEFVDSPFHSLSKTRQLLDAADLRIMLPLH